MRLIKCLQAAKNLWKERMFFSWLNCISTVIPDLYTKKANTSVPQLSKLQYNVKAEKVYLSFHGEWSYTNVTVCLAFGHATVRLPSNFEKSGFSFVRECSLTDTIFPTRYWLLAHKLHSKHHTPLGFFLSNQETIGGGKGCFIGGTSLRSAQIFLSIFPEITGLTF